MRSVIISSAQSPGRRVGQYCAHAAAKREGFEKNDVIVEFDGRIELLREADILVHGRINQIAGFYPGESVGP